MLLTRQDLRVLASWSSPESDLGVAPHSSPACFSVHLTFFHDVTLAWSPAPHKYMIWYSPGLLTFVEIIMIIRNTCLKLNDVLLPILKINNTVNIPELLMAHRHWIPKDVITACCAVQSKDGLFSWETQGCFIWAYRFNGVWIVYWSFPSGEWGESSGNGRSLCVKFKEGRRGNSAEVRVGQDSSGSIGQPAMLPFVGPAESMGSMLVVRRPFNEQCGACNKMETNTWQGVN